MYKRIISYIIVVSMLVSVGGCKLFKEPIKTENKSVPEGFNTSSQDTTNSAKVKWRNYFNDVNLIALIDTALSKNQELNIVKQEIEIARSEVRTRKGEYLPFLNVGAGVGVDKVGKYTRNGAVEENLNIQPHTKFPEPLGDFMVGVNFSWELDVWKKLRNSKNAAVQRYLASVEGRNFMVTKLVAEIANSYYELLALDNELEMIQRNIELQQNALNIVKQQKEAAQVTQLAVNRFEAQLLNTQNLQYQVKQEIIETENKINFLTGRFPTPIKRDAGSFYSMVFDSISSGVPSQLLQNRPDIRQAEYELAASKLDIKVAKANFYPSFKITAAAGFQAFNPVVWFNPWSLLYNVLGDMVAPLINRNALVAAYKTSRAKQVQAVYNYERSILNAYNEVVNQLSGIDNYTKSHDTKAKEVDILSQSISISNNLFKSARADYIEVLLTQREALNSRMELIEIKQKQLAAEIDIYKALGGGWN
ncbi:MAG: efflux transporter outer membrane subunit [Chitinophagales bacterium]|nr:efflux transporter outer membrane subunit [Chitinophagales bacterium]